MILSIRSVRFMSASKASTPPAFSKTFRRHSLRMIRYAYMTSRLFRKMSSRCSQTFCSRSEEHTSELQSLMRNSYAVFCLKKKNIIDTTIGHTPRVQHYNDRYLRNVLDQSRH